MNLKLRTTILALSLVGAFVLAACVAPTSEQATPVQENVESTEPASTSEEATPVQEEAESSEPATTSEEAIPVREGTDSAELCHCVLRRLPNGAYYQSTWYYNRTMAEKQLPGLTSGKSVNRFPDRSWCPI